MQASALRYSKERKALVMTTFEIPAAPADWTPAGVWIRVSTGMQDEENQVPDVLRYCERNRLRIVKVYQLNDKSAYKGEQTAKQNEALDDTRAGVIRRVVCWASDRVERQGAEATLRIFRLFREAGGGLDSVLEPILNGEDPDLMLAITGWKDQQESKRKSERVRIAFDTIDTNGAVRYRAPYGYRITGEKKNKRLVFDAIEAEIVREIFRRYEDGDTLQQIADALMARGVPAPTFKGKPGIIWYPKTLSGILRNPIYAGRWMNEERTTTIMRLPENLTLVSLARWRACDKRLLSRAHRRGVPQRETSALLTSVLFCGKCGGAMYRQKSGAAGRQKVWNADKTAKIVRTYATAVKLVYYCRSGKGCRMMIEEREMDRLFEAWLQTAFRDRTITRDVLVAGNDYQNEIDQLERDLAEMMQDVTADDFIARVSAARAEIIRLRESAEPAHTETRTISGSEIVSIWTATTDAGARRRMLLDAQLRFYVRRTDAGVELSTDSPVPRDTAGNLKH
jgi:DNA invertase Pin-like site-specific DNA recombinase